MRSVAKTVSGKGLVLEDATGLYSPENWGRIACRLYHKWGADRIVGEKNFGGDMVRAVIRGADPNVAFKDVTASRGKAVRAEPVAALYERGLISHCGSFPVLEDEMLNFTTLGYMGTGSPNHCDALVWGLTELYSRGDGGGLAEYLSETAGAIERGEMTMADGIPKDKPTEKVIAKVATSTLIKPTTSSDTPGCPSCGSLALVRIGKQIKCNQCGMSSGPGSEVPLPAGAKRTEWLLNK
jgi:ribosomal protein L37AE/L43A